ncbi:hypothetical protein ACFL4N_09425 [Thermodesulfobacteriota bacterium]
MGWHGGLSQRSNSKLTKCHYHAPYLDLSVAVQAQKTISPLTTVSWGLSASGGLSGEWKLWIGAVLWNSE